MTPVTFRQSIPGEWLDQYRRLFGDPIMAGVSYKFPDWYGYDSYRVGTHVPTRQPPQQGVTSDMISPARKAARLFLMSIASLWGLQTDTGTPTFAYSGVCDQAWWNDYFDDVAGNRYQRFVGATWEPLEGYGFVLWGSPAPPVAWNLVYESDPSTVYAVQPWEMLAVHSIAPDESILRVYAMALCAGSRRIHFRSVGWSATNILVDDVRLVLERGPTWWNPMSLNWNNMPEDWTQVSQWAPAAGVDVRVFSAEPTSSYRLRFLPESIIQDTPGWLSVASIGDVTLYGHA